MRMWQCTQGTAQQLLKWERALALQEVFHHCLLNALQEAWCVFKK